MNVFESDFFRNSKFHWDFIRKIKNIEQWEILCKQYKKNNNFLNKESTIPKIIHQIWIGPKKLPDSYKKWMRTWVKYNPKYEYRLWRDEDILKLNMKNEKKYNESKNVGIKSDIARYEILNIYGGIYVDTDFECLKSIPKYLHHYDFVSSIIFDFKPVIANGFIMSKKNSILVENIIQNLNLEISSNNIEYIINNSGPGLLTKEYFNLNNKARDKCLILPSNILYPYPNFLINKSNDRKQMITESSFGLHHWEMSWMKGSILKRVLLKIKKIIQNLHTN